MHQRGRFMMMGNVKVKIDALECGHGSKKKKGTGCAEHQDSG